MTPDSDVLSKRSTIVPTLGNYCTKLSICDEQLMIFCDEDLGPIWLMNAEKLATKYDSNIGLIYKREDTKAELLTSSNRQYFDTKKEDI